MAGEDGEGQRVAKPQGGGGMAEEGFRLLVEAVKDYAIFMLDPTGHVLTWNAGAERIKWFSAEEIVGQHFSRFYPREDVVAGKCEYELEVASRDGRFEDEGWRVRKDGSMFWANVVITAVHDRTGRLVGFAKVTRDLSERRRLEQEQIRVAQAQEAIRLRDEFLSIASHELKTPLTVMQLQLEGLRERRDGVDARTATKIDRAARNCERLLDLVDALLDVSRIATGRFELNRRRFDLADVVREVSEQLHDSADKAGCELRVRVDGAAPGTWDHLRVQQVLTNLVSNALKYASGAPVDIALSQRRGRAVVEVRDRGPGIPDADLPRIFERFERAAPTKHYGGLGLGLYVARQIVEAHGGAIDAQNDPAGGAVFTFELPMEQGAVASVGAAELR
jgi:PAS domain S-box-containing protein